MDNKEDFYSLKEAKVKIVEDLQKSRKRWHKAPKIYVGKTENFEDAESRHNREGYSILLRVAIGSRSSISALESYINEVLSHSVEWNLQNVNGGSGGNPAADKLYICIDPSVPGDEMGEMDEILLGTEYPINVE